MSLSKTSQFLPGNCDRLLTCPGLETLLGLSSFSRKSFLESVLHFKAPGGSKKQLTSQSLRCLSVCTSLIDLVKIIVLCQDE